MLLENRNIAVRENMNGFAENSAWKFWKIAMLNRRLLNSAGAGMKNGVVNKLFKDSWGLHRSSIQFSGKSFNQLWKERNKTSSPR